MVGSGATRGKEAGSLGPERCMLCRGIRERVCGDWGISDVKTCQKSNLREIIELYSGQIWHHHEKKRGWTYLKTSNPRVSVGVCLGLRYRPTQGSICWKLQNTPHSTIIRVAHFKAEKGLPSTAPAADMSSHEHVQPLSAPSDQSILQETKLETSSMIQIGFCRFQDNSLVSVFRGQNALLQLNSQSTWKVFKPPKKQQTNLWTLVY